MYKCYIPINLHVHYLHLPDVSVADDDHCHLLEVVVEADDDHCHDVEADDAGCPH